MDDFEKRRDAAAEAFASSADKLKFPFLYVKNVGFKAGADFGYAEGLAELESLREVVKIQGQTIKRLSTIPLKPLSEDMQAEITRLQNRDSFDLLFIQHDLVEAESEVERLRARLAEADKLVEAIRSAEKYLDSLAFISASSRMRELDEETWECAMFERDKLSETLTAWRAAGGKGE